MVPSVFCTTPSVFQSTLPRGERRRTADGADRRCYFNPRSHEGSDPGSHCRRQPGAYFNPRSHEGSDDDKPCVESIRVNFNPRSHEGSDMLSVFRSKAFVISIHAPTRGATLYYLQGQTHSHDFNPRSHEGSDAFNILCYLLTFYFNPRSHEGSDTSVEHSPRYSEISIHAPTRGATYSCDGCPFNVEFQSTLPRGERLNNQDQRGESVYFNPRSHEGSDVQCVFVFHGVGISIHAPTRGATGKPGHSLSVKGISIHAPTRGATESFPNTLCPFDISIHAPTRGATLPLNCMTWTS